MHFDSQLLSETPEIQSFFQSLNLSQSQPAKQNEKNAPD